MRKGDFADMQTFNEVILRNAYHISGLSQVKVIVDCGANIGWASLAFLNEFPDAKLISIEPEKRNYELAEANLRPYRVKDNRDIELLRKCVHNNIGYYSLVDSRYSNAYRISNVESEDDSQNYVESITIQQIIQDFNLEKIDILKIDIEGSEYDLFAKDTEWLSHVKCLIIETHDNIRQGSTKMLFNAISSFDYRMVIEGRNLIFHFGS